MIGNLTELTGLFLESNALSGDIPSELGNLTKLQSLFMGHNELTGCVPESLRRVVEQDSDVARLGLPFC